MLSDSRNYFGFVVAEFSELVHTTKSLGCLHSLQGTGRRETLGTRLTQPAVIICNYQGGERLGGETSGPLFMQCVMRSRTGTSAPSALPVRFQAGKIFLSTNRKSHFLSLIISQECVMIK